MELLCAMTALGQTFLPFSVTRKNVNSLFTNDAFLKTSSSAYRSAGNKHNNNPAKERGLLFIL
jgi:hypothetical protein